MNTVNELVTVGVEPLADGQVKCATCQIPKDAAADFSTLQTGKQSTVCKRCRADAANEWTTNRADYRKDYHNALRLQNMGYPVILPNAKDWKQGDTLLLTDGRNAIEVYEADKAARKAQRDELRAKLNEDAERIRADRKAQREVQRQARLQAASEQAAKRDEEREARKSAKAEAAAQKATEAAQLKATRKAERDAERAQKAQERATAATEKAAQRATEREQKARERAEAAAQKAAQRETERLDKARLKAEQAAQKAAEKAAASEPSVATVAETVETGAVEVEPEVENFGGSATLGKLNEMFNS